MATSSFLVSDNLRNSEGTSPPSLSSSLSPFPSLSTQLVEADGYPPLSPVLLEVSAIFMPPSPSLLMGKMLGLCKNINQRVWCRPAQF